MSEPFVVRPRAVAQPFTRPPAATAVPGGAGWAAPAAVEATAVRPVAVTSVAVRPVAATGLTARAAAGLPAASMRGHPALARMSLLLDDPAVTDVFVNGDDGVFVDRGGGAVRETGWHADDDEVRDLAVALIGLGGRHIDDASPCVDVRLEGGVRVHAVLPPIARCGTVISIRVPRRELLGMPELQAAGMFDAAGRARLQRLVADRVNLLITGAAGSGKTTLLAALLSCVPPTERIVTIEDVAELRVAHPHHVALESRQPNLEGAGGIDLARLVREALRMRPDRLVVGECRGTEVRELLSALNTGHDGGAGTLHANGLVDVPARLEALGALAGLGDVALARQVASAIGCVIHLTRDAAGVRHVAGVGIPAVHDGRLVVEAQP